MLLDIDESHPRIVALREGLASKIPVPAHHTAAKEELMRLDLCDVLWAWTNWAYRSVPARKRAIVVADGFDKSSMSAIENDALDEICRRIENGDELQPYLSQKNDTHGYAGSVEIGDNRPKWLDSDGDKDLALNAYQMHHLHLGRLKAGAEYCRRTSKLAYIHFNRKTAFLVHIGNHKSFNDGSLAQESARWHAQQGFHLEGVVGLSVEYGEGELKKLERAGISSTRKTDFGFVPSALMTEGHSFIASSHADNCWHAINEIEHRFQTTVGRQAFFAEIGIDAPKDEINIVWGMSHCDLTVGNGEINQGVIVVRGPN